MNRNILLLALFSILLLVGCEKDDEAAAEGPAQVSFTFAPYFDGSEMQISQRFINGDGYPLYISSLKFYLSNLRLITEDSTVVPLSDIEIVDFRNMHSTLSYNIPYGNYTQIAFDLGVPAELNSPENPDFSISVFDGNHPLSESNGMYWGWQGGYRFFSIDGFCDTVPNQDEVLPLSYGLHSGLDTLFRSVPVFNHPFDVSSNDVALVPFAINLNTFFENGSSHIDLKYERQFHGNLSVLPLGIKIADNSAAAFEIID